MLVAVPNLGFLQGGPATVTAKTNSVNRLGCASHTKAVPLNCDAVIQCKTSATNGDLGQLKTSVVLPARLVGLATNVRYFSLR